ncbi:sugar transferase [Candidatus Avoscillospira sp. LCP25S3_F1]|uniref:sugar transferase n=1 Tax=Candidatus Avoscillospira sp. LCP25S3_F1 TaxID=3438825 RepID=UPI003F90957B
MIETPQKILLVLPSRGTLRRKRIFDIVGAFCGLLVLSPIFLLAALAVRLSSPGEVFFRQERMGLGGKPFVIYKFRTMRKDNAGLKITTSGDSRITPVGRILRKSKLDELPQLFNVLKGDMSFVGPRPEVKEYTDLYTEEERQVFLVRPGITGVASIRYRNENDVLAASTDPNWTYIHEIMPEKLRLDLTYIPKASVWYDIQLIFETFAVIVKG